MLISVDIKGIGNHIPILYKEQTEIQELIDCLCAWCEQAELDGWADVERIEKLLQIARAQEQSIQRRIDALNDAVDQFSDVDKTVKEILDGTAREIRYFEGIL